MPVVDNVFSVSPVFDWKKTSAGVSHSIWTHMALVRERVLLLPPEPLPFRLLENFKMSNDFPSGEALWPTRL